MNRREMVEQQLQGRGIRDAAVLAAMGRVPREAFVQPGLAAFAYDDRPLPIGSGQTISQPYIVAHMLEALALQPTDHVLEIGTGSGYAAALLGELAARVITIERRPELAERARQVLTARGYQRIEIHCADGTLGWPAGAPYQAIVVAAGGPQVPETLLAQLAIGGRLVIPVGPPHVQQLVRVVREDAVRYRHDDLGAVMFVPLIGAHGRSDSNN